ncbi:hypothetical protein [Mesobacillus maritimus]|uniref:Uncharacterized protein n=1 Tax=Mesobacillus maritimus TaxID=1643336 RepID=A0ABS7KAK6_9BACI|nr:hypothetical protein [Mesobacillus maritimus]MBY0099150.1 hypothetical protein [Mesobacillus maritimus]
MSPSRSSFLYLSDLEILEDMKRAGIALDAVERIVISRKHTKKDEPNQVPGYIEETCCHECGEKVKSQEVVVLDSLFYLRHQQCNQETENSTKGVGSYNDIATRFGVFRRKDGGYPVTDSTTHNKEMIEMESENIVQPL